MATVTGWDKAKEKAEEVSQGSGKYLQLKNDGDTAVVAFLGEPCAREVLWVDAGGGKQKPVAFTDEHVKEGKKPRLQVGFAVYNKATQQVQTFEQGVVFFRQVLKVRDKYGLDKWWFEVKRDGAAGSQKTTYTVLPEEKITAEELKDLKGLELPNLEEELSKDRDEEEGSGGGSDGKSDAKSAESNAGGTISDAARTKLVAKLKELSKEKQDECLAHFEIKRVRDLPQSKAKAAMAFAEKLAAPAPAADSAPAEADPFD